MDYKALLKKTIPHLVSILAMLIVASIYFQPAWEGKSIQKGDTISGKGKTREKNDYNKYENKTLVWNSTIFSGMPDYVYAPYKGGTILKQIFYAPMAIGIPREIASLFWYMLGFFILLLCMKINPWLSLAGSIVFALTTYNLIIIDAGHYTKVYTLSLIPPTIGGILLCFRGRYKLGFIITSLFLAMQINMGHTQMTYYFGIAVFVIGVIEFYSLIREKEFKKILSVTITLFLAILFAIGPNYSRLSGLAKFNKHTIRGKNELTIGNKENKTKSGLDKDYINEWSSGRTESMMLFLPNVKGGATGLVKNSKSLLKKAPAKDRNMLGNMNQYWGNQIFSGAPNYIGIVIFFLFFIGLFIIPGRLKFGILFSTLLLTLLSMGGNLSFFTNIFIDYVPLYNKFRAPVSILAIVAILIVFFAFYTLSQISQDTTILLRKKKTFLSKKEIPVYILVTSGFVAFLLLNLLFPNLLNSFISNAEHTQFNNLIQKQNANSQITNLINSLTNFRISIFKADLWRAIFFSIATAMALFLLSKKKIKVVLAVASIFLLAMIDLWGVGIKYVNHKSFSKKNIVAEYYKLTPVDKQIYQLEIKQNPILSDKIQEAFQKFSPKDENEKNALETYIVNKYSNYRVLNLTKSPFQENNTARAHRSVGGFIGYKLRRYQDMIEYHIGKNNFDVWNMLNTKYIITPNGLRQNPDAMGSAWFVDSVYWAKDANEEILSLNKINISNTATINIADKEMVTNYSAKTDGDSIYLNSIHPEHLEYKANISGNRLTVFSEIYYPDWKVFIDGEETKCFTSNYILRGIVIPKGEHTIEFIFDPEHFYKANIISNTFMYLFFIVLLLLGLGGIIKKRFVGRAPK